MLLGGQFGFVYVLFGSFSFFDKANDVVLQAFTNISKVVYL